MASVLPFVRGVDFSRVQFQVIIVICLYYLYLILFNKNGSLEDKVRDMSNLRWLRLNRAQFRELPEDIDCFSKLVS